MKKFIKLLLKILGLEIRHYKEPSYSKIIRKLGVTLVLDVGANAGQFSRSLRENGYKGKIVSFEPTKVAYNHLLKSSSLDSEWIVHPRAALGSEIGSTKINVAGNGGMSSSILEMRLTHKESAPGSIYLSDENVDLITIDSVFDKYACKADIVFLKIDVQGYEDHVLIGSKLSIEKITAIKLELSLTSLYEGDKLYDFYFSKLEALGFEIFDLDPGHRNHTTGKLLQFDSIYVKNSIN